MKERLIDLMIEAKKEEPDEGSFTDWLADYLLANGVIVLPCKLGTTLYFLYNSPYADKPDLTPRIYESNKWYFVIGKKGVSINPSLIHGYNGIYHYYLGETVFLTREKAEMAMTERSKS